MKFLINTRYGAARQSDSELLLLLIVSHTSAKVMVFIFFLQLKVRIALSSYRIITLMKAANSSSDGFVRLAVAAGYLTG